MCDLLCVYVCFYCRKPQCQLQVALSSIFSFVST